MKKFLIVSIFSLLIFFSNSCVFKPVSGNSSNPASSSATVQYNINDYFSYKADSKYIYEGVGNEFASFTVFVDYLESGVVQLRKITGGSEIVNVIKASGGMMSVLTTRGECYFRENFLAMTGTDTEILLKEPLIKGTTWTVSDPQSMSTSLQRYISNIDVEIVTKSGTYKTLEVTTIEGENKTLDYYATEAGLVKSVFKSGKTEVSSTLSKIEQNVALVQTVRFFYPDVINDKIFYVDKKIPFNTNDSTPTVFEKSFKELPDVKFGQILSSGAKMNSMIAGADNIVTVDFSQEFIDGMNAGSGYESMILQCITNTVGTYYNTDKVVITIANKPYASGHIELKEGEFFTVDVSSASPYSGND